MRLAVEEEQDEPLMLLVAVGRERTGKLLKYNNVSVNHHITFYFKKGTTESG